MAKMPLANDPLGKPEGIAPTFGGSNDGSAPVTDTADSESGPDGFTSAATAGSGFSRGWDQPLEESEESSATSSTTDQQPRSPLDPFSLPTSEGIAWSQPPSESAEYGVTPTALSPPTSGPAPLPRRPKGRMLVGSCLLALTMLVVYMVWDTFFRYQAYGVITGRLIQVSAPWRGIVDGFHIREGELVQQGQLLVTIEDFQLEQQLAQIGDQLRMAQAEVDSEISRLQWQSQAHGDRSQKAIAEYYELWGTLLQEQAKLTELQLKRGRLVRLREHDAVTEDKWDAVRFAAAGQAAKVEKLVTAVEEMKKRVELSRHDGEHAFGQLQPKLIRIQTLQGEHERLRDQIRQGQIRSPVDGRVVKRSRFAGEYADAAQPVVTVLEEGSLEAVLYLSQRRANLLDIDQLVDLHVHPLRRPFKCRVLRINDQLKAAPASIERNYRSDEKLVPVHLEPDPMHYGRETTPLRVGSEVKLPAEWANPIQWLANVLRRS